MADERVRVICLDETGNLQYQPSGILHYAFLNRRELPPEDYNAPDLSYATQPCGVDINGVQQVLLFRYNESAQSHEPHQTAQPLTTSSSEPLPSTSEPVQGQNTESQSNSSGVNKTGAVNEFSYEATVLLIATYEELKPKFADARYKKKDVWNEVAQILQKHGEHYSWSECSKKWSNLEIRYKKVLDNNQSDRKSGRGRKEWEHFQRMHEVCGRCASSVSLRAVAGKKSKVNFKPPPQVTATKPNPTPPVDQQSACSSDSNQLVQQSNQLIRPSSDTDSDDVLESGSLKASHSVVPRKRKPRQSTAPEWFLDAESRMQEWRDELRGRMDKQEKLQTKRTEVLEETNALLKELIKSTAREN